MSEQGKHITEVLDASGGSVTHASEAVLAAATGSGLVVAATGPGQYQLTRTYRAGWVVPVAVVGVLFFGIGILLLFLVPKKTEICAVTITEDRSGVQVDLSGVVVRSFAERLRTTLGSPATAAPGAVPPPPIAAASPTVYGPPPGVDGRPSQFAPLISHIPDAQPPASPAPASEADTHATILRGSVSGMRTASQPVDGSPPRLVIQGSAEVVGAGLIIGRNPSPADALPGARLVPIGDGELSKTHLAVRSGSTTLEVRDLASTNGSAIVIAGVEQPCAPGVWTTAPPGSIVRAGSQQMDVR